MATVYIGVGSNQEPRRHVRSALAALAARFGLLRVSPVYAGAAVGGDGPEYLNLVVGCESEEPPEAVAAALKAIERAHGRGATRALCPLDLDLLLYGDLVLETPTLRLPRPDIDRYAFVLRPLAELAPQARHPLSGKSFAELWADFPAADQPLQSVEIELP